jgi:hypothetical protein
MSSSRVVLIGIFSSVLVGIIGVGCLADPTRSGDKKFCDPTDVSKLALVVPPNAQPDAAPVDFSGDCNKCMQDNCCAEVGACADESSHCLSDVADNFKCLVRASSEGTVDKTGCGTQSARGAAVTTCLTTSCATSCGITPALCQPSPAAPLIVGSDCDRCMSNKCCFDLNACYASRPCKNAFNCIAACQSEVAIRKIDGARASACQADGGFSDGGMPEDFTPSDCVNQCLASFFFGQFASPENAKSPSTGPGCLSLNLFSCLGDQCTNDCSHTDIHPQAGPEAGADAQPEASTAMDASDDANDGAPE